ncbi:hypothetical protein [Methanosarcina siciliae]|uniref:hypothetical protein n=1 Tax=Methanosarcina siciliae TaxID=38027 RepID=UPI00064EB668|nr:hypothetical protein [Methanosarcina siciliae]
MFKKTQKLSVFPALNAQNTVCAKSLGEGLPMTRDIKKAVSRKMTFKIREKASRTGLKQKA